MNFDDLMEVWRSQDVSPLHGVNETLLRLSLQQSEANVQNWRRRATWIVYMVTAFVVADLARYLATTIFRHDNVVSGWDYVIGIFGAGAALLNARLVHVRQQTRTADEQRFGESLRDQIERQLALLDRATTRQRLASLLGMLLLPAICAIALILAHGRMSGRPFVDGKLWVTIIFVVCWIGFRSNASNWGRSWLQQRVLPRRRRLEALLKELDAED